MLWFRSIVVEIISERSRGFRKSTTIERNRDGNIPTSHGITARSPRQLCNSWDFPALTIIDRRSLVALVFDQDFPALTIIDPVSGSKVVVFLNGYSG